MYYRCPDTQTFRPTRAIVVYTLWLVGLIDDDDEIAYFTVRWKTRASFVYRTKNMR